MARAADTFFPSPEERRAAGKAARARVPRSGHREWGAEGKRPDPVDILEQQAKSRVSDLIPLRYGRMLVSPFTFYRGAAAVMASDLADSPKSGFSVQLCGDAHLTNFGGFASPERRQVFDINDFDETLPGPWEWDVKRLAASLAIGGSDRSFGKRERRKIVAAAVAEYRASMRRLASMGNLDAWYSHLDVSAISERWSADVDKEQRKTFKRNVVKARSKDSMRAFAKLTHEVDGRLRIISDPPVIIPIEELVGEDREAEIAERIGAILDDYRATLVDDHRHILDRYRYVHAAVKVVGVGSVGTRAWIVLMVGRDNGDPLFLQIKEAQESVLEPHTSASAFVSQGERVVKGQKLMQAASDIFLGWVTTEGLDGEDHDFYVRQLWDWKGSARVDLMSPRSLAVYGRICGDALARAHARSGDAIAIAAYLGKGDAFDKAIVDFADAYTDQNERDYRAVREAADAGRIAVRRDEAA